MPNLPDISSLSPPLFFIAGVPRSGTTWVQNLCNAHPEIACFGEADLCRHFMTSVETGLRAYNRHCHAANPHKTLPISGFSDDSVKHIIRFAFLSLAQDNISEPLSSYKAVGEKSPDTLEYLPTMRTIFPDAKIVHVIRDGRDAAVSGWWRFARPRGLSTSLDNYVKDFTHAWAERIESARSFAAHQPEQYLEVRYERLFLESQSELKRLYRFLGGSTDPDILSDCIESCRFKELSGGRSPGEEVRESHYRRGEIGDWRNHLSETTLSGLSLEARNMLNDLGYDLQ